MKLRSEKDFWAGLLFTVVGAGAAIAALDLDFGTPAMPGPGYIPFGLGAMTVLVGAVLLFKSLTLETEGGDRIGRWATRPLALVAGTTLSFGWILPALGAWMAVPLLVIATVLAGRRMPVRQALLQVVVLSALAWAACAWLAHIGVRWLP